jgi:hypothetical protein
MKATAQYTKKIEQTEVDSLIASAQFFEDSGNYKRAEHLLSEAIRVTERNPNFDRLLLAEYLHNVGLLNICLDELSKAKMYLKKSIAIRLELLGPRHSDTLDSQEALLSAEAERLELIS